MLYSMFRQSKTVEVWKSIGPKQQFSCDEMDKLSVCPASFGQMLASLDRGGHGTHVAVDEAVEIRGLLTCAAVVYIYTDANNQVKDVFAYHAHTGAIPKDSLPTASVNNRFNVPLNQIHVLFISALDVGDTQMSEGVQTAADGLIDIYNAGIPKANIGMLLNAGATVAVNGCGEIGIRLKRCWSKGGAHSLVDALTDVASDALKVYKAQFPQGQTTLGFMGGEHNLMKGTSKISSFKNSLFVAQNDEACLVLLENFLSTGFSFKTGSIKLCFVGKLNAAFRSVQLSPTITALNAKTEASMVIAGIRSGLI